MSSAEAAALIGHGLSVCVGGQVCVQQWADKARGEAFHSLGPTHALCAWLPPLGTRASRFIHVGARVRTPLLFMVTWHSRVWCNAYVCLWMMAFGLLLLVGYRFPRGMCPFFLGIFQQDHMATWCWTFWETVKTWLVINILQKWWFTQSCWGRLWSNQEHQVNAFVSHDADSHFTSATKSVLRCLAWGGHLLRTAPGASVMLAAFISDSPWNLRRAVLWS